MLLGNLAIKAAIESGAIVCDPAPAVIEGTHIDVRLGHHYWVADAKPSCINLSNADSKHCYTYGTAAEHDGCIVFRPGRLYLCHTEEFIGTSVPHILPVMHGRSTLARWGVQVHLSAGWGDPFYHSRWTLEVVNHNTHAVAIPVGSRIACVAFMRVEGCDSLYTNRYNVNPDDWTPAAMLPKRVSK